RHQHRRRRRFQVRRFRRVLRRNPLSLCLGSDHRGGDESAGGRHGAKRQCERQLLAAHVRVPLLTRRASHVQNALIASIAAGVLSAGMLVAPVAGQSKAQGATDKVVIRGWALNMSNIATGANQTIQITINSWSTAAQRKHLIDTFLAKKQDGLLSELEKQPERGRFNFPGYMGPDPNNTMRLGTDIRYAMNFAGEDGGRRIVIITPRVIGFREAANQPRTVDYPFTLFEMRFNKDGKGEGRMAYATQINFDKKKGQIELENYSSEPVRLNNLELEVKKK